MKIYFFIQLILMFCTYFNSFSWEITALKNIDENNEILPKGACFQFEDTLIFMGHSLYVPDSIYSTKLFFYFNNSFKSVDAYENFKGTNPYNSLAFKNFIKDKNNDYWLAFDTGGIFRKEGEKYISYKDTFLTKYNIKYVNALHIDDEMKFYIISQDNLYRWDGHKLDTLADHYSDKAFKPHLSTQFIVMKDKLYFLNFNTKIAYYDFSKNKIDTLSFSSFMKQSPYNINSFEKYNGEIYFTYSYDTTKLYFAKYDGEKFTELDYYLDLINGGEPMNIPVNFSIDSDNTFYFSYENFKGSKDTLYIVDKNLNKTSLYIMQFNSANNTFLASKGGFKLSDGRVVFMNSVDGLLILTNPSSVETPTNLMFVNRVYPNPAEGTFSVDFAVEPANLSKMKIEICDYLGRSAGNLNPDIIYDASSGKGTMKCEASSVPKGMYIVVVSNGTYKRAMNLFLN